MAKQFLEHTPATGAAAMYGLKTLLKAAGWTVPSSSDGTTYNASGDQITHGGSGAGGLVNTNAWFRLRHPLGTMEYTVQRTNSNTAWRVKISAAGFGAGSPGATQTPQNTTDQGVVLGVGTDASPSGASFFGNDGTYRHKAGVDDVTGEFWSGAFPIGGGSQTHAWFHEDLIACHPSDGAKWACCVKTSFTQLSNSGSSGINTYVPAVTPTTVAVQCAFDLRDNTANAFPNGMTTHPISGKDDAIPKILGRRAAIANPAYKGIGATFPLVGVARATGSTLSVDSLADHMVMSDIRVFWSGNDSPET